MPAHKLPALIAKADLGVVPYRNDVFTDALLPTKLMEYALMGVPTIAASTTAISSYFDETMVQFFNPGNLEELVQSILELHTDRDRLAQLGKGIQKFNQDYSWENLSKDYVNLVETLGR
jgi:glycosyltransferase involved in cell wall biosynthesis